MKTIKQNIFTIVLVGITFLTTAQSNTEGVKISNDVSPPNPSAMLEVASDNKGVLFPQVDIIDLSTADPVTSPANGLMVFNTNTTSGMGYYYWNEFTPTTGNWVSFSGGSPNVNESWKIIGTTGSMENGESIPIFNQNFGSIIAYGTTLGYQPLSIRKRIDGVVEISGYVNLPSPPSNGTIDLFQLPNGYTSNLIYHRGFMSPENDDKVYQNLYINGQIFQLKYYSQGKTFIQVEFQAY